MLLPSGHLRFVVPSLVDAVPSMVTELRQQFGLHYQIGVKTVTSIV